MISRILHGPPDWIVSKTTARHRRTFGFWTAIIAILLFPFLGNMVFYVSGLSLLALVPNFTAETPVEPE